MNPLINYNKNINFWDICSGYKLPFKDIFNKDKSKNQEISSKIMWFLAFMCEQDDNPYYDCPEEDRIDLIIGDLGIEYPKGYMELLSRYKTLCLSYTQRKLINWKKKLDERDEFIGKTSYNDDNYEMLDKMMANSDKLFKQYYNIMNELSKNKIDRNLGGGEVSLTDKGDI